jgi:hypothetical protein
MSWSSHRAVPSFAAAETAEVYAGFDEDKTDGDPHPDRVNADGTIRLAASAQMRLELRFTDQQGRRWVRDERGVLTSVS